jgi:hypothetical protein
LGAWATVPPLEAARPADLFFDRMIFSGKMKRFVLDPDFDPDFDSDIDLDWDMQTQTNAPS